MGASVGERRPPCTEPVWECCQCREGRHRDRETLMSQQQRPFTWLQLRKQVHDLGLVRQMKLKSFVSSLSSETVSVSGTEIILSVTYGGGRQGLGPMILCLGASYVPWQRALPWR